MDKYNIGDIIKVKVTGIKSYGIFVNIDNVYSGLIHISEISDKYVKNIRDFVRVNDYIYAKIVSIDAIDKTFRLSIKNINYKKDGKIIKHNKINNNGFEPLQEHLEYWIDEKIKEIMKNF